MFENIIKFFKKGNKKEGKQASNNSKDAAKERLHLVLMQDRANVSADFLELMKQEIIDVIKKYIDVDENAIDVRLTNKENEDGTNGAPALYADIPILNIKNEARKIDIKNSETAKKEEVKEVEENNKIKEAKEETENIEDEKSEVNEKKEEQKINETEKLEKPEKEENKEQIAEDKKEEQVGNKQQEKKEENKSKEKINSKN